mgnify:CR=1 FL=1
MAITAPNTQQMISRALKNDKMAARFTSTLIGAVSASEALKACDPGTIIAAGLRGEGMGLIYGHGYYIVPYNSVATYLMSYKGYIQLAMSTGYYADIDCVEVREGELEGRSRRTGKPAINLAKYDTDEERESHKIIGYYAYFELKDGTFRYEYWSMDKLLKHADRYSPAFKLDKYNALIKGELDAKEQTKLLNGTPWYDVNGGQDKMCRKTMMRRFLRSSFPASPTDFCISSCRTIHLCATVWAVVRLGREPYLTGGAILNISRDLTMERHPSSMNSSRFMLQFVIQLTELLIPMLQPDKDLNAYHDPQPAGDVLQQVFHHSTSCDQNSRRQSTQL